MSLFASTNDGGVHIERVNAEKIGKRGIFINVADDNGRTQSEHQTAGFIRLRNNLNISPGERRREAFTKTLSKVRDNALYKNTIKRRRETLPLHPNYANYENTIPKFATKGGSKFWCEDRLNFGRVLKKLKYGSLENLRRFQLIFRAYEAERIKNN